VQKADEPVKRKAEEEEETKSDNNNKKQKTDSKKSKKPADSESESSSSSSSESETESSSDEEEEKPTWQAALKADNHGKAIQLLVAEVAKVRSCSPFCKEKTQPQLLRLEKRWESNPFVCCCD